jgi:hypothetical protein
MTETSEPSTHAAQLAWIQAEHQEAVNDLAWRLFNFTHKRAVTLNLETGIVAAAFVTAIANSLAHGSKTPEICGLLPRAVEHAVAEMHNDPTPAEVHF